MASDRIRGDTPTKKIILDTSAILMLFEFSIDLEEELKRIIGKHKILIPTPIIKELEIITNRGDGRQNKIAKAALKLIEKYDTIETKGKGDEAIVNLATSSKYIVVTNDKLLRNRLKEIPIQTIYLKTKKKLELD